jgi:hypothetical protein
MGRGLFLFSAEIRPASRPSVIYCCLAEGNGPGVANRKNSKKTEPAHLTLPRISRVAV